MEFTEKDCKEIYDVINTINNGCESFLEYVPLMIFESEDDQAIVEKGLNILKSKVDGINRADHYGELKKYLKVKKIVKDVRRKEVGCE